MDCREIQNLLDGYFDGELDLVRSLEIERHLQDCSACTRIYQNQKALHSTIKDDSLYFNAPANLQKRVLSAVRETSKDKTQRGIFSWRWVYVAASVAFAALIIFGFVLIQSRPAADDLLAQEVVSGHVRSMMANHLTDVPSSDNHTVKPCFDGKLDFAPPVSDLTAQGFSLIGGRLDYIGNKPIAALVYQRRQHFINLFVWLSTDDSESKNKMMTRQGYNLIRWNKSGMTFWAVSDLNLNELQQFVQAVQNPN